MSDAYIRREDMDVLEELAEDLYEMNSSGAIELSEWPAAQHFLDIVKELTR